MFILIYSIIRITVQVVEEEGKRAIDLPGSPSPFDISPEDYNLGEVSNFGCTAIILVRFFL